MAGASAVGDHVGSGTAQVADGFLGWGGDANGDQLASPVQPGQPPAVTGIGLDPVTGGGGDQRGGDHLAADPHRRQQPG
jgi:hypothetical protein